MLKSIVFIFCLSALYCEVHKKVIEQALEWHSIQQDLNDAYIKYNEIQGNRDQDDQEFFSIQQQLAAIYLAQKRYQLGFGTAMMPSKNALHNYVRKKTFLNLKTKELLPLYKNHLIAYQKKYGSEKFILLQKNITRLEELNLKHTKVFKELEERFNIDERKSKKPIVEVTSIETVLSGIAATKKINRANKNLSWINPVAGIKVNTNEAVWKPLAGAIVVCPDQGTVVAIAKLKESYAVFVMQDDFVYVLNGIKSCCVREGDKLEQGSPVGFISEEDPCLFELSLWRENIPLDPMPYHKAFSL